jgi:nicotinamide-nucleotide amidase
MNKTLQPMKEAVVLAVGSELLTAHKLDTNSLFLTERLNEFGISIRYKAVIGDHESDLATAISDATQRADLVIVTGGLGPTDDDVTRAAVAMAFGVLLKEDESVMASILSRFKFRGLNMPDVNRRQALVPEGGQVLENTQGTAPGIWMERESVICLLLPGPPRELRPMFDQVLEERIAPRTHGQRLFRRVLMVVGRSESHVEELTYPVYSRWQSSEPAISTTILASLGQLEIHLSTRSDDAREAGRILEDAIDELGSVLGKALVSASGESLEIVVSRLLRQCGCRIAVAESCTGGLVASRLTDVPGSSAYLLAAWVTYSNEAKVALGVNAEVILDKGAVSEDVAKAMAVAARQCATADYGLGITGIAGPGGGSVQKPVGTVWFALAGRDSIVRCREFRFVGDRSRIKLQATQTALDMLRRELELR